VEMVDIDHRGIWWTRKQEFGIWRSKNGKDQYILIKDKSGEERIVIRNNEDGPIQIYCKQDIEIYSGRDINMQAKQDISLKAGGNIIFQAEEQITSKAGISIDQDGGGGQWKLNNESTTQNVTDKAPEHTGHLPGAMPGPGAQDDTGGPSNPLDGSEVTELKEDKIEPADRAKTNNGPFTEVPEKVITVK